MSKLRDKLKKVNAGFLAAAIVLSSLHISGPVAQASTPEFNADDVVLRVGVLSDPHFLYTDEDDGYLADRVTRYHNAITYLNNRANNQLDVLMLGGDYTGTGSEVQGTVFAEATRGALDIINANKEEADATKLILAYGNHDTDWGGQMDYAGWENVLNKYSLLDDVEKGPEGCYKATVKNDGKTYHFYSLETYNYNNPSNMFLTEVLEWIDEELNAVTKNDPNSYVYIVSHGPIWESGVYGSDIEFERNATWGTAKSGFKGTATGGRETSSDLHNVLRKYPQVVYFSGHTHRTNILESTIMQKDYTAINVAAVNGGDLFAADPKEFVEGNYDASRPGYVMLVEVDSDGNQRITRINIENNSVCGEPWIMPAPNAEKTHLQTYTQEARRNTPVFASGATLNIDNIAYTEGKEQMTFDATFDAATCDSFVFRYELVLYDQNGKSIDTKWMVGNWTDHKTGVKTGTSHFDATKFKYSLSVDRADLFGATGIYAKLYAVDEFGGRSEALTWKSQDSLQSVALLKPTGDKANRNLLDGFTSAKVAKTKLTSNNYGVNIVDNGDTSLTVTTTGKEGQIVYTLNEQYADKITSGTGGLLGQYATKLSTFGVNDTFVWETDFAKTSGGNVYLAFRAPNAGGQYWKNAFTGLALTSNGAELWLDYERIATSDAFKLTDTNTHRIQIVSAPTKVSVWVDDIEVFADADFTYPAASLKKLNNATTPYEHRYKDLTNQERWTVLYDTYMYPAIGICAEKAATYTVGNQLLYLYNSEDQVADSSEVLKVQSTELYNPDSVGCDRTQFNFSSTENKLTVTTSSDTNTALWFTQTFDNVLSVTDTVVTEFEFTPTNMRNTDSTLWGGGNIVGINFRFRTDGTNNATIMMRVNASQNMLYFADANNRVLTKEAKVQNGKTVKVKVISDNTKATIWIDDVLVAENLEFTKVQPAVNTASMKPILQVGITNATWEISNISVKKAVEEMTGVTPITEENNLLESQFVNIKSNIMGLSGDWKNHPKTIVNGTNIYTDMTKATMTAAGVPSNYHTWQENFTFWGASGHDPKISPNDSYVFSTLAKIYNTKAENDGIVSRYRMRFASYNGVNTGFILDDTKLMIMENDNTVAQMNITPQTGYTVGDEVRVTAIVSPFGWDLYFDGHHLYSYKAPTGSTVDYKGLQLSVGGTKARFLDTSVHYNNDNGELYKEKILEQVANYEVEKKGIWYENKADADVEVAKIKALCEGLDTTSNASLKTYINSVSDAIASGKITNNMVWDGTASIGQSASINLDGNANANWSWGHIKYFNSGVQMKRGETWVFEADVNCDTGWSNKRLGFGLSDGVDNPEIMIQNSEGLYYSNGWQNIGKVSGEWKTGQNWHVKFVVKPFESVQAVYTNNANDALIWDTTYDWGVLSKTSGATEDTVFWPRLNFACVDATVTNPYVGYDVTNDVASLKAAATAAKDVTTEGYTPASVRAFEEAIAEADAIGVACTDAFTNPYSKAEINAAEAAIATAEAALVRPTAELVIGTETLGEVLYGVVNGEALPTGYVEDKYVLGWTLNGAAATKYDALNDVSDYVADYIDRDMLDVAWQQSATKDTLFRFIGSVNDTEKYSAVGFEFSLDNNKWYDLGKQTTVYEQIKENTSTKTAKDLYGSYSTHVFVQPLDFGSYTEVYVRSYVVLEDGETVVYGDVSLKDVTAYGQK